MAEITYFPGRGRIKDRTGDKPGERRCSGKCKRSLPPTMFRKNRAIPDGLDKWCKDCKNDLETRSREKFPERFEARRRQYHARLRLAALTRYGSVCACCGEDRTEFLAVDHVDGGGNQQRKEIGGGSAFFLWLKNNNYPSGYRVLCHNCNSSLGFYGYCPHDSERKVASGERII